MERRDLKVFGCTDREGGIYRDILIMGSGDIKGNVECRSYKVFGSGDLNGNIKSETIKINGSGYIKGDAYGIDVSINGSGDINGNVKCSTLKIAGASDIKGNVEGIEVGIYGTCDIDGNCECEIFNGKGAFEIKGELIADEVNIEVIRSCEVGSIGAGRVIVRGIGTEGFKSFTFFKGKGEGKFKCDVIEGDEIYLEKTEANTIRGKNIVIGPGCKIESIEYSDNLEIDDESKVEQIIKL
ncbi:cell shape determination protein CcmA [Oceanirhabdus sp. W0125-5]|uniref:cell shape determination protein CcmA n=1 Tax=Oceanirhabdus sp. W0125-5 TaxID=2999116 RepID=UPI0022F2FED7|nr:cell shape determination protein CcmA [Oceanirhabdus sp. W0125-5]WBW98066.1 cell shape determination protein CcmA [Oceanirhabdus sp. W0125-5]